jgi:hypothetical protein
VPAHVIERPDTITAAEIATEQNAEVRRVMLERIGEDRFVREGGATLVHEDDFGQLYKLADDTLAVRVLNSTPEPERRDGLVQRADGTWVKPYWIYVHPELRPMTRTADGRVELGQPQPMTAHAAVASTFGLTAAQYQPVFES